MLFFNASGYIEVLCVSVRNDMTSVEVEIALTMINQPLANEYFEAKFVSRRERLISIASFLCPK